MSTNGVKVAITAYLTTLAFLAIALVGVVWVAKVHHQSIVASSLLPACQYEDGNPGGMPCIWTDPDTGDRYLNDGRNYRNPEIPPEADVRVVWCILPNGVEGPYCHEWN